MEEAERDCGRYNKPLGYAERGGMVTGGRLDGGPVDRKRAPVPQAISELEKACAMLAEEVSVLEQRLSPVLGPESPADCAKDAEQSIPTTVASQINYSLRHLGAIRGRVRAMRKRLEV